MTAFPAPRVGANNEPHTGPHLKPKKAIAANSLERETLLPVVNLGCAAGLRDVACQGLPCQPAPVSQNMDKPGNSMESP